MVNEVLETEKKQIVERMRQSKVGNQLIMKLAQTLNFLRKKNFHFQIEENLQLTLAIMLYEKLHPTQFNLSWITPKDLKI